MHVNPSLAMGLVTFFSVTLVALAVLVIFGLTIRGVWIKTTLDAQNANANAQQTAIVGLEKRCSLLERRLASVESEKALLALKLDAAIQENQLFEGILRIFISVKSSLPPAERTQIEHLFREIHERRTKAEEAMWQLKASQGYLDAILQDVPEAKKGERAA